MNLFELSEKMQSIFLMISQGEDYFTTNIKKKDIDIKVNGGKIKIDAYILASKDNYCLIFDIAGIVGTCKKVYSSILDSMIKNIDNMQDFDELVQNIPSVPMDSILCYVQTNKGIFDINDVILNFNYKRYLISLHFLAKF